jgi:hypothetical protein
LTGIVSIGLAVLLFLGLPWSSLWLLGTIIAIELVFHGVGWITLGFALRGMQSAEQQLHAQYRALTNAGGREGRFDIRHLFNGLVDSYLYHSGRVSTTLPFAELRRRSLINEAAQAAESAPDFSQRIRASLPTIPR